MIERKLSWCQSNWDFFECFDVLNILSYMFESPIDYFNGNPTMISIHEKFHASLSLQSLIAFSNEVPSTH